jgi:hypothetical protein
LALISEIHLVIFLILVYTYIAMKDDDLLGDRYLQGHKGAALMGGILMLP